MRTIFFLILLNITTAAVSYGQDPLATDKHRRDISYLIDKYSQAREQSDTALLAGILTRDIDQLVSTGEWRRGIQDSMKGMARSSGNNPGKRTLTVDKIRFLNPSTAIVDARYEIENADGTARRMWSTFIVVFEKNSWKITAIRNMLPAGRS